MVAWIACGVVKRRLRVWLVIGQLEFYATIHPDDTEQRHGKDPAIESPQDLPSFNHSQQGNSSSSIRIITVELMD